MPRSGPVGEQIGYEVYPGPEGALPLLLLHGFTASSAAFSSNIEALRRAFTVVTVDLLGHGDSDAPEDVELYGPGPAVARITRLLDELGYPEAMVCGHSLGGALALRLALEAPERVAALAVINSNSAAGNPEWRRRATHAMREMAARVRSEGIEFLRQSRLYPAASKRLPGEARELLVRDFNRLQPAGVAGTAVGLAVPVNAYERLGELQVPLLVMIGDRDQDFVRNSIDFLDQLPPDMVSWTTIEGAGHAANLEQPEQFERALIDFARDCEYLPPAPLAVAAGAPSRGPGASATLSVLGGALIVAGVIMVAGAFFVGRDNGSAGPQLPAVSDDDGATATATPTAVEAVSGVSTAGPEFVTSTPAVQPTATSPASSATAAPPTATIPPEPTATTAQPVVINTPVPEDTPTPAPTPTATLSPTPTGPFAAISGPGSGAIGEIAYFRNASSPGFLGVKWAGCNQGIEANGCSIPLVEAGCHLVTLVANFPLPDGAKVATHYVAVGDGTTCP